MKRALMMIGVVVAVSAAWASEVVASAPDTSITATQVFGQRIDTDEVSRPLPPNGPATPIPYCSPGQPICP